MTPYENIEVTAQWANTGHVPHDLLTHYLAQKRTEVGKQEGWTDEQIAVSKGITPRQEYQQRQEFKNRGLEEEMQRFLADGRSPLDRILDLTRPGQPITMSGVIQALPGFTLAELAVIIKHGLKRGVLKLAGTVNESAAQQLYEATGKQHRYPAAITPPQRAARSMRATLVARDCRECDVYFTRRGGLTNEGVQRIHQFLDPDKGEAITLNKLETREGATNFGVLLVFTQHSSEDKQKRDPLWRAITRPPHWAMVFGASSFCHSHLRRWPA